MTTQTLDMATVEAIIAEKTGMSSELIALTLRNLATTKVGKECKCGCGGITKGGTWLPGHDAKAHSAAMGGSKSKIPKECRCGCGGMTKGGIYRPGHDAKHLSSTLKTLRTETIVEQVA